MKLIQFEIVSYEAERIHQLVVLHLHEYPVERTCGPRQQKMKLMATMQPLTLSSLRKRPTGRKRLGDWFKRRKRRLDQSIGEFTRRISTVLDHGGIGCLFWPRSLFSKELKCSKVTGYERGPPV